MRAEAACRLALQIATLLTVTAVLHVSPATAQGSAAAVPDTRDMIEALKPSRSRNLLVRQTAPAVAVAPAASGVAVVPFTPSPSPAPMPAPTPPATPAATAATTPPAATAAATPLPATTPPPAPSPTPSTLAPPAPAPAPSLVTSPPRPVATTPAAGNPAGEAPPSVSLAIQFELNSARVRPESGALLGNLVAAMTSPDLKSHRFVIEGHTDARGNPAANKLLSQQRADEVRLYLVALGVHPARLRAVGKGSSELANAREPMSAVNRRVRVVTLE